jgi:hypothetical protein
MGRCMVNRMMNLLSPPSRPLELQYLSPCVWHDTGLRDNIMCGTGFG